MSQLTPDQEGGQYWPKAKRYGKHLEYIEGLEAKIAYHEGMIEEAEQEIQRIDAIIAGEREEGQPNLPCKH